jgi:glycosyltransferase involved in cell wall biosynthesis
MARIFYPDIFSDVLLPTALRHGSMTDVLKDGTARIIPAPATEAGFAAYLTCVAPIAPPLRLLEGDRDPAHARSILIVLHDFALGGTERIAVRLANEWTRTGSAVRIFAGALHGPLLTMLDPSIRIVSPDAPIIRARGSQWRLAAAAARHAAAEPADGCFIPGNYHWPVAALMSRLPEAVRPVIVSQVSAAISKPQRGPVRQFVFNMRMRRLLRRVDAMAAMCESARQQTDRILRRPKTTTIMLPALDSKVPHPTAPPASNQTIIAAGRLVPEKGFDTLIAAFARLIDGGRNPTARLVIVGDGPDQSRLAALAASLGVSDRITMPGYVADIRPWLDRSRLFVLSSRFEGYGAVMIEALAAGRPIVSTDCTPAARELLPDFTAGRIVPIDDPDAMARAIAAMLAAAPSDPVRLAASVERYRIEPVARQYLELFDWIAASRRAEARRDSFGSRSEKRRMGAVLPLHG